jgi:SAM-dependent methyltransferase
MRSDQEWRFWGRHDPLWSVASWAGRQVGGPTPWTPEEFLALGESDFRDIHKHWRHFGIDSGTCVEIGCGAGRMTAQLTEVFEHVVALDVSEDQLKLARRLLGERAEKVTFVPVDGATIPVADQSAAGMFSCHVFQHFSQFSGIESYLRETFRVLKPGGSACFHIPVPGAHRGMAVSKRKLAVINASIALRRLFGARHIMEYHQYYPARIFATLHAVGFRDLELRIFDMTSNGDPHSFFFARKA